MKGFYQTYIGIIETIDYCIKKERIIPGLILLYSAIDSFSNISNRTSKTGREVFKNWVKKWMLEKSTLACNEADIYAARCGLLHTLISESDLSKKNEAKEIYYVYGKKQIEILQQVIDKSIDKQGKVIAVKVEDLVSAFRQGMADCMDKINNDFEWEKQFSEKASKYFINYTYQ